MDMMIANWQISVHRARKSNALLVGAPSEEERDPIMRRVNQARQAARHESERAQIHQWFLLHGGR